MGRGGKNSGRGQRGSRRGSHSQRAPFKSRNRTSNFIDAQKRKNAELYEEQRKKMKADEDVPEASFTSSDESEPEMDNHTKLLQTFAGAASVGEDSASSSEEDNDNSSDLGDETEEDASDISSQKVEINSDTGDEADDNSDEFEETDDDSDGDDPDHNNSSEEEDGGDAVQDDEEDVVSEADSLDAVDGTLSRMKRKDKVKALLKAAEDLDEEEEQLLPSQDDPFSRHFERYLLPESSEALHDPTAWQTQYMTWPGLGSMKHCYPDPSKHDDGNSGNKKGGRKRPLLLLSRPQKPPPTFGNAITAPPSVDSFDMDDLGIKQNIQKNIDEMSDLQKQLLSVVTNYTDLHYPQSTHDKWDDVTKVYCIHAVNHVLKTRARILLNNSKINKAKLSNTELDMNQFEDQGYARPKVLILLPSRHSAYRVVQCIIDLLQLTGPEGVMQKRRFMEEFGPGETGSGTLPRSKRDKPPDFVATFTGDTSDDFKIGITINKKSMRLYTSFYSSDLILASPLGMRLSTGVEGEQDNDTGFLTSVELLILDQADIFLMQNWEHVLAVLENTNQGLQSVSELVCHGRRVRRWLVDGHAKLYRQTLLFASTLDDRLRALFTRNTNFAGRMELLPPTGVGLVGEIHANAELLLLRAPGLNEAEQRFAFFAKEFLPQYVASKKTHTLLYIPDSSDYHVINDFLSQERAFDFSSINEYMTTKMSQVAVARSDFFKGASSMLLYTERFHFYKRPVIKGVRHLVFYSLPVYPHFFPEMCNMMLVSKQKMALSREQKLHRPSITVFYQKTDVTKLAAVLGTKSTRDLLSTDKTVHMCTVAGR